jgi:hypothetical protein
MVLAELKIKCWRCGREEEIIEILADGTIDFNADRPCPSCFGFWMTKKELTLSRR